MRRGWCKGIIVPYRRSVYYKGAIISIVTPSVRGRTTALSCTRLWTLLYGEKCSPLLFTDSLQMTSNARCEQVYMVGPYCSSVGGSFFDAYVGNALHFDRSSTHIIGSLYRYNTNSNITAEQLTSDAQTFFSGEPHQWNIAFAWATFTIDLTFHYTVCTYSSYNQMVYLLLCSISFSYFVSYW